MTAHVVVPAVAGGGIAAIAVALACWRLGRWPRTTIPERAPTPTVMSHPHDPQPETWELLNEEGRHLLDAQRSTAERVETKAALVIGAALTLLQFVTDESRESYWLPAAVGFYSLSILLGILCVRPRTFDNVGLDEALRGVWWLPRGYAAAEIVNNRNIAIKQNAKRHQARVIWFWLALSSLAVGAVLSAGHVGFGRSTDDNERLNGTCTPASQSSTFICTADP